MTAKHTSGARRCLISLSFLEKKQSAVKHCGKRRLVGSLDVWHRLLQF